jgi:hypothetical protein
MRKRFNKCYRIRKRGGSKWKPRDWKLLNEFEHRWKGRRRSKA